MEYQRRSLLGRYGRFVLKMSLVLDQLPSGRERLYQLDQRSFRAVARGGLTESRFTAATGVVALSRQSEQRLRGSFRLPARKQTSRWFGGWRRPTNYLMQGTFSAVYDQKRGFPIVAATESQGWDRAPVRSKAPVPAQVSGGVAHGFSRGERESREGQFASPTSEEVGHPINGHPSNQR